MKILQVHNSYQIAGGEDVVVRAEKSLLEKNGHQVVQLLKSNDNIHGLRSKLSLLFFTHYSVKSKREVQEILKKEKPDIAHVHNFFPLFSPSIFEAFAEAQVPVVFTLHNYRLLHPNGLMLHEGKVDRRSLKGSAYNCVWDGVYRSSVIQTAVVAHMIEYHRAKGTWHHLVDTFIALSDFAKEIFIQGGLPETKITVKPNYLQSILSHEPLGAEARNDFIYLGRISEEKGLEQLLEYWIANQTRVLQIVGEGPQLNLLQARYQHDNIIWWGRLDRNKSLELLSKCKALILPSVWFENFPMTILESFGRGIPVISNNFGSHGSLIDHEFNGYLYDPSEPSQLSLAIDAMSDMKLLDELSNNAHATYREKYTEKINYSQLIKIYESIS